MKWYLIALALIAVSPAIGHDFVSKTKTIHVFDNATKEPVGTITITGNKAYYRDAQGVHYQTVEIAPDGTRTFYDPSGSLIKTAPADKNLFNDAN